MPYFYQVYGLQVISDIELPELVQSRKQTGDVEIKLDSVPESLPRSNAAGKWANYIGNRCLFRIDNVGRFLIENGQSIKVEPYGSSDIEGGVAAAPADVRLYLLGSALAALLHQRSLLPLHVSAVLSKNGVWAFTGPSGAGKSTIAGWLSQKAGLPLISDDVSVVDVQNDAVRLYPGPRKLKLWNDAVDFLELGERKLVQDLSNTPKFQLYLPDDIPGTEFKLSGIILLERAEPGQPAELIPVTGINRFRVCCNAVYRYYMAPWFRTKADYVQDVFQLAESIQIFRLRRPWSLEQLSNESNPLWELLLSDENRELISQ